MVKDKNAYVQKLEAELELLQARVAELKAKTKSAAADVQIQHGNLLEEVEQKFNAAKARLKELKETGSDAWEHLKEGTEKAWETLRGAVSEAAAKFKH
jgi:peptidoglycan hydrolase CwlO-like protein